MRETRLDKTKEEIIKESAEVLGRAGERLVAALEELDKIERLIEGKAGLLGSLAAPQRGNGGPAPGRRPPSAEELLRAEINREIRKYNRAREYAKLRYYYLIVTREAVGFRRHKTVEEHFKIPPKKKPF